MKALLVAITNQARSVCPYFPDFVETDVVIEPVPCTVTSLEFFDRLLDPANGVVNRCGDGGIRGCFEEVFDNFLVADELRQVGSDFALGNII